MRTRGSCTLPLLLVLLAGTAAHAQVTQSVGSGSAVSTVDATASFESTGALFDRSYVENGLVFTRTSLTYDNNTCGFAGCFGWDNFSGNYMYGAGDYGFFSMFAGAGRAFLGLEFAVDNGWGTAMTDVRWEAFLQGSAVGSGTTSVASGSVVGFASLGGFDELRYTSQGPWSTTQRAPAFDEVRAQFVAESATVTPEPVSMALLGTGLAGGGVLRRRRRKETTPA